MISPLTRAIRALRGDTRPDWIATSIALFTAATVLASVTIAGYIVIGGRILDGKEVILDAWLVRLASIPVVFILSAYFATVVSSLSIIFHTADALREEALKQSAIALYFQVVFTIIFALVMIFGGVFLYGNSDSSKKPRITSANYDSTNDEVVLAWEMDNTDDLLAFRIERRVAQAATEGTHEELLGPLPNTERISDNRPIVSKAARLYFDSRPPAARLTSYTVWAVYPDGTELASEPLMAKMRGMIVRARIHNTGDIHRYIVSWLDDSRTDDASGCAVGRDKYKIYLKTAAHGMARWAQLTTDADPPREAYAFIADGRAIKAGEFTIRVMCGGISPDTGVFIGEDTSQAR